MDSRAWQGYSPWGLKELDMTEVTKQQQQKALSGWGRSQGVGILAAPILHPKVKIAAYSGSSTKAVLHR